MGLGWSGPTHWAGLNPKVLGRSRPKYYYSLLGQTRPRRQDPGPSQNGRGELFSPHPCMQNAIRSACREGKEKKTRE